VSLIGLGADPTGEADASDVFDAAIAAAAALQNRSAAGSEFWVLGSHRVTIDLGGGLFSISRPLLLHGANASQTTLSGGALQATAGFPRNGFMVDVGGWALGVTLADLVLDAAGRCGGIRVNGAEQTTIDRVFVVHYATFGLLGDNAAGQSNELLVSTSYFAEKQWNEPGFNSTAAQNGTAIHMKFCDSHFTNVIVRCTLIGIYDEGGGNAYQNVHVYSTCNKGSPENVATGVVLAAEGMRLSGCNFDDSPVLVTSAVDVLISNSVFYGYSGLIFAPLQAAIPWARGVIVTGNLFQGTSYAPNPTILYDTSRGSIDASRLSGYVVSDNAFSLGAPVRATRGTAVIPVALPAGGAPPCAAFAAVIDVSETLIFHPPAPAPAHLVHAPAVAAALARCAAAAPPAAAAAAAAVAASPLLPSPFSPGLASITGTFTLTGAGAGEFGVFNAAPTPAFGVVNVSAARVSLGGQPSACPALTGAITLSFDSASPIGVSVRAL
jgi:hypothetical protein